MRVIHIVKTLELAYGGPARSVQGLVAALQGAGVEAYLVSLDDGGEPWVDGIRHYHCMCAHGCLDSYRKMLALIDEIQPDLIHTHDCWMPRLHMCHKAARKRKIPYVISPRGSLKTWSLRHKWLKKWIALHTYEGYDLSKAAALHVTADDEYEQVAGLGKNKVIFKIANGVNLPAKGSLAKERQAFPKKNQKRVLYFGRIHYTKGLMNLVEAWAKIRPSGWVVEIAGTDADGYLKEICRRVQELNMQDCFVFSGPANDNDKWSRYVQADIFVNPSFSENFSIVVAEALYAGLPVIATKGAPWKELQENNCGWWIEIGIDPLVSNLKKALQLSDDERAQMGGRGHDLIVRKYSWPALGRQMLKAYQGIIASL